MEGNEAVDFAGAGRRSTYELIARTLGRFGYRGLARSDKALVRRYLAKVTGRSRGGFAPVPRYGHTGGGGSVGCDRPHFGRGGPGEPLEQPFEPRHALAKVGDVGPEPADAGTDVGAHRGDVPCDEAMESEPHTGDRTDDADEGDDVRAGSP